MFWDSNSALSFLDLVDDDPNAMNWEEIVHKLKQKYRNLLGQDLWEPQKAQSKEADSVLDGLQAAIG
jgi:ABC-type cobalt transport system substrate-binding protein